MCRNEHGQVADVVFTTRQLAQALESKGFRKRQSHHAVYVLYVGDRKTSVVTRLSHGHREYGDALLGQLAKQLGLSRAELNDLILCPLSGAQYVWILEERGRIRSQGVSVSRKTPRRTRR